jgi:pimeloyl-ACP methyl ester carboxylesterase
MGKQVIAAGTGHFIHIDQPELVIAAIREVVEAARR